MPEHLFDQWEWKGATGGGSHPSKVGSEPPHHLVNFIGQKHGNIFSWFVESLLILSKPKNLIVPLTKISLIWANLYQRLLILGIDLNPEEQKAQLQSLKKQRALKKVKYNVTADEIY